MSTLADFNVSECVAHKIEIFIGGNAPDAQRICREFCLNKGFCVTVTPTEYVYTGGQEAGVVVGIINYARFPRQRNELFDIAKELAIKLADGLYQKSFTIQTSDQSFFLSRAKLASS